MRRMAAFEKGLKQFFDWLAVLPTRICGPVLSMKLGGGVAGNGRSRVETSRAFVPLELPNRS
jgi:hypothetical protein